MNTKAGKGARNVRLFRHNKSAKVYSFIMRIQRLDGLRAIAVGAVALHHHLLVSGGWVGVALATHWRLRLPPHPLLPAGGSSRQNSPKAPLEFGSVVPMVMVGWESCRVTDGERN